MVEFLELFGEAPKCYKIESKQDFAKIEGINGEAKLRVDGGISP